MPRKPGESKYELLKDVKARVLEEVFAGLQHEAAVQGKQFNQNAIQQDLAILYGRFERSVLENFVSEMSELHEEVGLNSQRYRQSMLARSIDKHLELGVFEKKKER